MSRAALATMLEVSSTSVQNWETGHAVATAKIQQRVAELMKAPRGGAAPAPETKGAAAAAPSRRATPAPAATNGNLVQATTAIVVEAIKAGGKRAIAPKDLSLLIRTVREALS